MRREWILVVEQEPHSVERISAALGAEGWSVRAVTTVDQALRSAAAERPDLVVAGTDVPGFDVLVFSFSRRGGGPGVLALDGQGGAGVPDGVDGQVAKPFTDQQVVLAARQALLARRPAAAAAPPPLNQMLTSQDIFGDVLAEVESGLPSRPVIAPPRGPAPSPPPTAETVPPRPAGAGSGEDVQRRLEKTLSGMLGTDPKPRPAAPPASPVVSPVSPAPALPPGVAPNRPVTTSTPCSAGRCPTWISGRPRPAPARSRRRPASRSPPAGAAGRRRSPAAGGDGCAQGEGGGGLRLRRARGAGPPHAAGHAAGNRGGAAGRAASSSASRRGAPPGRGPHTGPGAAARAAAARLRAARSTRAASPGAAAGPLRDLGRRAGRGRRHPADPRLQRRGERSARRALRPVHAARTDRGRRHGRGLEGADAGCGGVPEDRRHQAHPPPPDRQRRVRGDVRRRGEARGAAQPPQHRPHLRSRQAGRDYFIAMEYVDGQGPAVAAQPRPARKAAATAARPRAC